MKKRSIPAILATLVVLGGWAAPYVRAELTEPAREQKFVAMAVCSYMERGHISKRKFDDEISKRTHKQFMQIFDPMKLYFTTADVDEFNAELDKHDEATLTGDMHFAFRVYNRFVERLQQRNDWVQEFIKGPVDFKKEDVIILDPDSAQYAKDDAEAKDRWRQRVKFELTSLIVDGEKEPEARTRIEKRYRNLLKRWKHIDTDELVEMYLTAVTNSFDPHSTYMSPRTLEDFNIGIQLSLEGIGALLQDEDGTTVVKEIVPGGAADKDKRLKPGDKIVGVAQGAEGEIVDIVDMKLRDVVKLIRGKAGTVVRLQVQTANAPKRENYDLVRQKIELQDREAKGEIIEMPKTGVDGHAHKIGVIKLPSFYADGEAGRDGAEGKSATNDVRRILEDFKAKGVDGVVMDLRINGGGLLSEAIGLTGLFIDEGPVVQVRDSNGQIIKYMDEDPGVVYNGPLVVLVSRLSASASEIFAGAIQDYGRGVVVGDSSTHGKGTVQRVVDLGAQMPGNRNLGNLGALKLTMQKFYRVNGQSTQNRGVLSDVVLPAITDHDDFGEAKLDYALDFDSIGKARYDTMSDVSVPMVEQLRTKSGERITQQKDLQDLKARKARVDERRARKVYTFNQDTLQKERDALSDEEKEELKNNDDNHDDKKDKKFGEDAYTKEVLAIMNDYLNLRHSTFTAR